MRQPGDRTVKWALMALAFTALTSLLLIAIFIFKEGIPFIARAGFKDFLLFSDWQPQAGHFGIYPMIVASLLVTLGAMLVGAPLGIACAVFLNEFVSKPVTRIIKPTIELLAGIPSVVYGFIGVVVVAPLIRSQFGGPGLSMLCASLILGVMVLPTIISISSDVLASVPNAFREGALALGATRWQSVHMVILKAGRSGIVAAVILGMGRAIGETMAVIMVAGNTVQLPHSALDSVCTLTAKIAMEMGSATGLHRQALFAIGVVLFLMIMMFNALAMMAIKKKTARK